MAEVILHLTLSIDAKYFAERIAQGIIAGGLTVVDTIEKLFGESLENSVMESLGDRLIKAPRSLVHPRYFCNRFENLDNLRHQGYHTWYPEIRFATQRDDTLEIKGVEANGFEQGYIRCGGGIERQYTYWRKELKTQVNHTVRLNKITISPCMFDKTIHEVVQFGTIGQPYIANLTVGYINFVDDRITGFRTVSFDHVVTGDRRFCQCHAKAHAIMLLDAKQMAPRFVPDSWPHRVIALLEPAIYSESVCHFCVAERHGEDALFDWYGSQIQNHYGSYVDLLVRCTEMDYRTAKAEAMRRLSISRWIREEELCRLVNQLFPSMMIRREASPNWLGQQRLDIFLPELALAIEHQGEQHYFPVEGFGGAKAFAKTQERDRRKKALCEKNGVTVVYVRFDDPLTVQSMQSRLRRWLGGDNSTGFSSARIGKSN